MLVEEALRRRQEWVFKGNPPCAHSVLDMEYCWGKHTGSYICITCGKSFTHDEWEQEIKKRQNQLASTVDSYAIRRRDRFSKGIQKFPKTVRKALHFFPNGDK